MEIYSKNEESWGIPSSPKEITKVTLACIKSTELATKN